MRKRLVCVLLACLLSVFILGGALIQFQSPPAFATQSAPPSDPHPSQAAKTACNQVESGGGSQILSVCETAYDDTLKYNYTSSSFCNYYGSGSRGNPANSSDCVAGYDAAIQSKQKAPPADPHPSQDAQTACGQIEQGGGPALATCELGYDDTTQYNYTNSNFCNYFGSGSKTSGSASDCVAGYDAAKNIGTQGAGSRGSQTASSTSTESPPTCDSSGVFLSWIFCGVIDSLSQGMDFLYTNLIQPLLIVNPVNLTSSGTSSAVFQVWSNFRIYGDVFLVVVLLVIVYSESIGGGFLDAYSVRKILPRLLIGAILINLSIYIVAFSIDVANVVGVGINSLMQAPFSASINSGNYYVLHMNPVVGAAGTALTIATIIAAIHYTSAFAAILIYIAVIILIPAFFIFLAIVATLVLRKGILLFLLFVSPVAFVLFCLPNTERYFRQWWNLLFRTLLVFPIIAVLFALGNILSVTISSSTSGVASIFSSLLGLMCIFLPLLLIPFSFRIAGGVMGRAYEFISQGTGRVSEGILGDKNDPESLRAKATAGRGRALAEAGWDTKGLSTRLNPRTLFNRNARNANIAAMREARMGVLGAKGLEGLSVWENNKSNDNTLLAHVDGDFAQQKLRKAQADAADESKTEEERADARTQISTWQQAISAASLLPQDNASKLAAAQRLFATGYQMEDGEEGYNRMASIVAKYTGNTLHWEKDEEGNSHIHGVEPGTNNGAYVNNMNLAQFSEKNAGRFDLAGLNNGQKFDLKEGLDKAPPYVLGTQAKPTVFKAAPKEYMGKDIGNEVNEIKAPSVIGKEEYDKKIQTAMTNLREAIESGKAQPERLIEWHDKLMSARGGAQGSNLDQMNTQIDVIRRAAGIDANGNVVQPAPGVAQDATQLRFTQGIKSNMDRYRALPPEGAINDAANQQGGGGNQGGNV